MVRSAIDLDLRDNLGNFMPLGPADAKIAEFYAKLLPFGQGNITTISPSARGLLPHREQLRHVSLQSRSGPARDCL